MPVRAAVAVCAADCRKKPAPHGIRGCGAVHGGRDSARTRRDPEKGANRVSWSRPPQDARQGRGGKKAPHPVPDLWAFGTWAHWRAPQAGAGPAARRLWTGRGRARRRDATAAPGLPHRAGRPAMPQNAPPLAGRVPGQASVPAPPALRGCLPSPPTPRRPAGRCGGHGSRAPGTDRRSPVHGFLLGCLAPGGGPGSRLPGPRPASVMPAAGTVPAF